MQKTLMKSSVFVLIVLAVSAPCAAGAGEIVDVSLLQMPPTVEMRVVEDTIAGWNVFVDVSHFSFRTGNERTALDPLQGFAQLHVDGEPVARVYGSAYHLGSLEPGEHEIRLSLHAVDGSALVLRGELVEDSVQVTEPHHRSGSHAHHGMHHGDPSSGIEVPEHASVPGVELGVTPDPLSGWTVETTVTDFSFTPEAAGAESRFGEGHAHLYVNGEKVARVYGKVYHLPELEPGVNRIRLTLNGNDHSPYTNDGEEIAAEITFEVEPLD